MTHRAAASDRSILAATFCAFAMIANQVAGKAIRDALFLSQFEVEALPRMIMGAAFVTIGAVLLATRALRTFGPRLLVPFAFAGSAAAQLALWPLIGREPKLAAVGLYVHIAVFGAVLISWFWSLITERMDPTTARRRIGRIAAGGTLGGLMGGILAERVAATLPMETMLPILAVLHLGCAGLAALVGRDVHDHAIGTDAEDSRSGFQVLAEIPYLRNLALLVAVTTISAGLLDWVFKARAAAAFADQELLRFFGLFYTGVALLTFLVQTTLTRRLLTRGVSVTISALPFLIAAGGLAAFFIPGLAAAGIVRGSETAARSSLFRSSYELFYNPIPRAAKRASKTLVDVGFDRLGDAVGGATIQVVLLLAAGAAQSILLAMASGLGLVGLLVARRLHRGYVGALESSLLDRAQALDAGGASADATQTQFDLTAAPPDLGETLMGTVSFDILEDEPDPPTQPTSAGTPVPSKAPQPTVARDTSSFASSDRIVAAAAELRSGQPDRVRQALRSLGTVPRELSAVIVPLLAWEEITPDAIRTLRRVADRDTGLLLDSLLDPDEEFTIRRRIPRVLAAATTDRAIQGLLHGLDDRRFEVRYQTGVALSRIRERHPNLTIDSAVIRAVVLREAAVDRRVWEGRRLLDHVDPETMSPFYDDLLRERASRTLEHVFTCLSLVYPKRPLEVAYRGLYASDPTLRGTALEYLEQVLPPDVRECLWPFLQAERRPKQAVAQQLDQVVESLLRSHESIELDLRRLKEKSAAEHARADENAGKEASPGDETDEPPDDPLDDEAAPRPS